MRNRQPISRRTMLRGVGVALGLPWLEAMAAPSRLPGAKPPAARAGWSCMLGIPPWVWKARADGRGLDHTILARGPQSPLIQLDRWIDQIGSMLSESVRLDGAIVEFRSVIDAVRCALEVQGGMVERREMWRALLLQHWASINILMDTPVKIANMTCFTGWFLEMDRSRGTPQLFEMTFEALGRVQGRLKEMQ